MQEMDSNFCWWGGGGGEEGSSIGLSQRKVCTTAPPPPWTPNILDLSHHNIQNRPMPMPMILWADISGPVSLITPVYPRTLQDSIICMFNMLYEHVDDGLVLVCLCIN